MVGKSMSRCGSTCGERPSFPWRSFALHVAAYAALVLGIPTLIVLFR